MQNIIDIQKHQTRRAVITDTRRQILRFIRDYTGAHGFAPSMREIGKAIYMSVTGIARHLEALESGGYLTRERNVPRSIVLTTVAMPAVKRPPVRYDRARLLAIADDVNRHAQDIRAVKPIAADAIVRLLDWHSWRCVDCGCQDSADHPLFVVHLLPLGKSGKHEVSNLSPRCGRCAGREPAPDGIEQAA